MNCPDSTSPTPEGQRVADRINALRARRERFAAANMWAFAHATDCAIRAIEDEMRATAPTTSGREGERG